MIKILLSSVLVFYSFGLFAGEEIFRPETAFNSISINVVEDLERARMPTLKSRDAFEKFIYPKYYIPGIKDEVYHWRAGGLVILESDLSTDRDDQKRKFIKEQLKNYFGEAEYLERMAELKKQYSQVSIEYYSFPENDRLMDGCISVRWKAFLSGIMHACGLHYSENNNLFFEIREYGDDSTGTLQDQSMTRKDALEVLELATAVLTIIYQYPQNQIMLKRDLSRKSRIKLRK